MKQCKTCIHKEVCEKAKHIENYRIGDCEHYKDESQYIERESLMERLRLQYCKGCTSYSGIKCRACTVDDILCDIEDAPCAPESR
jgi:hypothetical protein